jgi:hypothetical protein
MLVLREPLVPLFRPRAGQPQYQMEHGLSRLHKGRGAPPPRCLEGHQRPAREPESPLSERQDSFYIFAGQVCQPLGKLGPDVLRKDGQAQRSGRPLPQEGEIAMQLLMLEAIERLEGDKSQRSDSASESALDDLLCGGREGSMEDSDPMAKVRGVKGAAGLMALNRAIAKEPDKWNEYVGRQAFEELGCHVTGMPCACGRC